MLPPPPSSPEHRVNASVQDAIIEAAIIDAAKRGEEGRPRTKLTGRLFAWVFVLIIVTALVLASLITVE
jgi:hypothetical protein